MQIGHFLKMIIHDMNGMPCGHSLADSRVADPFPPKKGKGRQRETNVATPHII